MQFVNWKPRARADKEIASQCTVWKIVEDLGDTCKLEPLVFFFINGQFCKPITTVLKKELKNSLEEEE